MQCHVHLPPAPCSAGMQAHGAALRTQLLSPTARDPCLAETGPRKPRPETGSPLPQASAGHTGCPEWSSPAGWDLVSLGRRRHWGTFSPQRPPLRKPCTPRLPACLLSSPLRTHLLLHVFLYLWRGWERACHGRDPPRTWLLLLTRPRHPPQHRGQRFGGSLSWSSPGTLAVKTGFRGDPASGLSAPCQR